MRSDYYVQFQESQKISENQVRCCTWVNVFNLESKFIFEFTLLDEYLLDLYKFISPQIGSTVSISLVNMNER